MGKRLALAVFVLVCVSGCSRFRGDTSTRDTPGSVPNEATGEDSPVVIDNSDLVTTLGDQPEAFAVAIARRMFAKEQGLEEASVAVVDSQAVTWNDGSLGCPKAGESYTQVITPGYRITVTDDKTNTAVYHAGSNQGGGTPTVIRCDKPAPAGDLSFGGAAVERAITDLKDRADASEVAVEDSFVAPVASLVCDDAVPSKPATGPSRVILEFHLRSGETSHVYRAWGEDILYCGTTADLSIE